MAAAKDFIPGDDTGYFNWQGNYMVRVNANLVPWGINPLVIAPLNTERTAYEAAYALIINPNTVTKGQTTDHRTKRTAYEKHIRAFNKEHVLYNSAISTNDKLALRITVPDTEPSPRRQIDTAPTVTVKSIGGGIMNFECRVEADSTRPSIHPDADDVELRYSVGTDPATWDDCPKVKMSRRAKFNLQLAAESISKRIYFFLRWHVVSDEGKSGPFTEKRSKLIGE